MSNYLQLRRPTTVSRLQQVIPKPPQALPKHGGLPLWENLPLDQKLPAKACPIHPPIFSRGNLGEIPWVKPDDYGFDLSDPLSHDVSYRYMQLHDKNLKSHFRDWKVTEGLKYHNLINDENEVICTLGEFNRFRYYLWKLHKHEIRKEFQKLDRAWWKQFLDRNAALHIKKYYDFEGKGQQKRCIAYALLQAKKQKALKLKAKYERQLLRFLACREKEKQSKMLDGHSRALKVRYNNALLKASRKSYRLKLKRRLREKDRMRTRRMAILKKRTRESKRIMQKERYKLLFISAQEAEANRQKLLNSFLQQTKTNVQKRVMESHLRQELFEQQLTLRKTQNLSSKYNKRSKAALMRAMLRAWHNIRVRQPHVSKQLSRASVEHAVNIAYHMHTTISPTISSTQIIDTARQLMNDFASMPSEQLPLDRQVMKYTSDALQGIMGQIREQVVRAGCQLIEQVAVKMRKRIQSAERRPTSLCGPWSSRWHRSSLNNNSSNSDRPRVSIGEVQIVDEFQTEQEEFKKSRNRPPTPVTSVTSLVEHIVDSNEMICSSSDLEIPSTVTADIERRITTEDHPLIHLTTRQKRYLETNLMKFRTIIYQNVRTRVLASIDVMRLEIVRRKFQKPSQSKETLAREAAHCVLVFPKEDHRYAQLLLDIINILDTEVCNELEDILNAP
ncbi:uncharacterized protein LOC128738347 [Sabethes cyaneus]|uniref:uncharacterized protein LOC128738347 n=1 Tax=Sabethes cyaneus TaxID=53552 RepID=UPI00237E1A8B|nr:uncharacterized protein LOC128738347 [Sabethes cyaneus]